MDRFTVSMAGVPIEIIPKCEEMRSFFRDYLCEEEPVFSIATTQKDLDDERAASDGVYEKEFGPIEWPDRRLEVMSIHRKAACQMPRYGVIVFHGSTVALDGKAYLFTAPSGTGKTTHTRLWLEQRPEAYMLNGDKPFLKVTEDGRVLACGSPWRGKEKLGCNETLPLAAICVLGRSAENRIREIQPREAAEFLLRSAYIPAGPANSLPALRVLDRISRSVRMFRLECNMEPEAARVSMAAMIGEKGKAGGA